MSHDLHFLERMERLSPDEQAFALSLYNNAPLVRAIVEQAAPAGAERVAIAIDDGPSPAHVLFDRDGRFVTCLARGMGHALPVVTRAAVAEAARRDGELRRRVESAMALRRDPDYLERALHVFDGPRLSREDARSLLEWAPALGDQIQLAYNQSVQKAALAQRRVVGAERLRPKVYGHLDRWYLRAWAASHLSAPTAAAQHDRLRRREPGDPDFLRTRFAHAGAFLRLRATALRGTWATLLAGEAAFEDCEHAWRECPTRSRVWACGLALAAFALRHDGLRARARAALAAVPVAWREPDEDDPRYLERLRLVMERPTEALARHHEAALRRLPVPADELDAPQVLASVLYDPRGVCRVEDWLEVADALAFAATSEWPDLYLPRDRLALWPPEDLPADERRFDEAHREEQRRWEARHPVQPEKAPPKVGRNDPCPCGSGRKHKKCCGA